MAFHPIADQCKVRLDSNEYGFGGDENKGVQTGVLVELPTKVAWIGYHSFALDASYGNGVVLDEVIKMYSEMKGKRVVWEALQQTGRRFKEADGEYVYLKLTDIIGYADDVADEITAVDERGFKA